MDAVVSALTNLGLGGLMLAALLVFAWYRETKTLPRLVEAFERQSEKDREQAAALAREERAACERHHQEVMTGVKDARHAVRNLEAQQALLTETVYREMDETPRVPAKGRRTQPQPKPPEAS